MRGSQLPCTPRAGRAAAQPQRARSCAQHAPSTPWAASTRGCCAQLHRRCSRRGQRMPMPTSTSFAPARECRRVVSAEVGPPPICEKVSLSPSFNSPRGQFSLQAFSLQAPPSSQPPHSLMAASMSAARCGHVDEGAVTCACREAGGVCPHNGDCIVSACRKCADEGLEAEADVHEGRMPSLSFGPWASCEAASCQRRSCGECEDDFINPASAAVVSSVTTTFSERAKRASRAFVRSATPISAKSATAV